MIISVGNDEIINEYFTLFCVNIWYGKGLHIREHAEDAHIFSPYATCNSKVWVNSDVLEVFATPVRHPTDNPRDYYEVDTGAKVQ